MNNQQSCKVFQPWEQIFAKSKVSISFYLREMHPICQPVEKQEDQKGKLG
jgi:hypothetical protein